MRTRPHIALPVSVRDLPFLIYAAILFLLCLVWVAPRLVYKTPAVGLDPSWQIGINLAVENNLRAACRQ